MPSDARVLIEVGGDTALAASLASRFEDVTVRDGWAEVAGEEDLAETLSRELDVTCIHWLIHTAVDQIWIKAFKKGRAVRELLYSSDGGWEVKKGRRLPHENEEAMPTFLRRRDLRASPDGYDVLDAFLGRGEYGPQETGPVDPARLRQMFSTVTREHDQRYLGLERLTDPPTGEEIDIAVAALLASLDTNRLDTRFRETFYDRLAKVKHPRIDDMLARVLRDEERRLFLGAVIHYDGRPALLAQLLRDFTALWAAGTRDGELFDRLSKVLRGRHARELGGDPPPPEVAGALGLRGVG
jgi:hypothetical protein